MLTTRAQEHPLTSPPISAVQNPLSFIQQAPSKPLESFTAPEPEPGTLQPVRQIRQKKVFSRPL